MTRRIIIRDKARFDVIETGYYIAVDSLDAADRFAQAVDTAYRQLAEMPDIGALREYKNAELSGMRMWPVPGFRKHLIFYNATKEEVRIIRVLHGAQDIEALFRTYNDVEI